MRNALGLAGSFCLIAAPALAQEACDPNETVYAVEQPALEIGAKPTLGRSAYACGRFWSAANLMTKSVNEHSGPLERFNLAASYAKLGRLNDAEDLYRSVATDGIYVRARDDTSYSDPISALGYSLAEEAQRRADGLQYVIALQMRSVQADAGRSTALVQNAPGPVTAVSQGSNAAETGFGDGPVAVNAVSTGELLAETVTDAEALRRDGLAPSSGQR